MTNDFIIWLDGVPVVVTPGGESFSTWLDGAPVIQPGGDDAIAAVSGTEIITETGTVIATGGAVATVTGSECITETGTCVGTGIAPCTGEEVLTETGTVVATGGAVAVVTGVECLTETGICTVTVTPPVPPPPIPVGSAGTIHHHVWDFPTREKKRPKRYKRAKREVFEDNLEVELPIVRVPEPIFIPSIAIARVQGSECRTSTGICNVRVDYPDDLETIKLIIDVMEMEKMAPKREYSGMRHNVINPNQDEEDLEIILMALETD